MVPVKSAIMKPIVRMKIRDILALHLRRWSALLLIGLFAFALGACSNPRLATSAGVDVRFGPNGPRVTPRMNVSIYSGGRY